MNAVDIIVKKRDGQVLSADEIRWFVDSYTQDEIPDYQASALLMAILLRGMDRAEIKELTLAMAESGEMLDLSDVIDYAVDKHSSGGVGDKTSLVVLPLVASCGVPVAKMSGRGLGFSGGTIDKLEAIPGFQVNISDKRFRELVKQYGIVLGGQSRELAPADGKLYALRDVTGTVPSLPLIASSIMSKKLAAGSDGIVLDVKVGSGAFMKNLDDARELAQMMVNIGTDARRDMVAVLSDMNQPLGVAVGNALEVKEAIATLQGEGPDDFLHHCLEIGGHMLQLAGQGKRWTTLNEAKDQLKQQIANGEGFAKFRTMVEAQGGDVSSVENPSQMPQAKIVEAIAAEKSGTIHAIDAEQIGLLAVFLGAGRAKKGDAIDLAVGLEVFCNVGDVVQEGDLLVNIHLDKPELLPEAITRLRGAIKIEEEPCAPLSLFYGTVTS